MTTDARDMNHHFGLFLIVESYEVQFTVDPLSLGPWIHPVVISLSQNV